MWRTATIRAWVLVPTAILLAGCVPGWRGCAARSGSDAPASPRIVLYTNPGATTPQVPFWGYLSGDTMPRREDVDVRMWKSTAHLQSLVLAGEGDVWLGHVEGFARARAAGAPVVLLTVTGWRKMSILTRGQTEFRLQDLYGTSLACAPPGSPAIPLLRALAGADADRIEFVPYEPNQLALSMMRGDVERALLPEPLVSVLLGKNPEFRVAADLEDLYAPLNDGRARIPWAGIAVHEEFLRSRPATVAALADGMRAAARSLADDPERAVAVLPESFAEVIPRDIVRASLARDPVHAEAAADVAAEIERFLLLAAPELGPEVVHALVAGPFLYRGAP